MQIGPYTLDAPLILAPMAGITDLPFRTLCRHQGAALAVSEMLASQSQLRSSRKSMLRARHEGEPGPISVQIVGTDPKVMAEAAQYNVTQGAQIIDINMGCPAKKVCKVAAGSALMRDEAQIARILEAVVGAVEAPVTLKIRTGWDIHSRNAARVARIAEESGIQALAIHGRTRCDFYNGDAEYDTIAEVKQAVNIPIIANGDITSPDQALHVLEHTRADAIMIGRGAQGRPWLFQRLRSIIEQGSDPGAPPLEQQQDIALRHIEAIQRFYGEPMGVRIARKHIAWYCADWTINPNLLKELKATDDPLDQLQRFKHMYDAQIMKEEAAA